MVHIGGEWMLVDDISLPCYVNDNRFHYVRSLGIAKGLPSRVISIEYDFA